METAIAIVTVICDSLVDSCLLVGLTLLPILGIMMMVKRALTLLGLLIPLTGSLSKPLKKVGLPPEAALAMVEILFVSFAAPAASLKELDDRGADPRRIACTLAMILALAQMNVTLPLFGDGLSAWTIPISVVGGLVAAVATNYLCRYWERRRTPPATQHAWVQQIQRVVWGMLGSLQKIQDQWSRVVTELQKWILGQTPLWFQAWLRTTSCGQTVSAGIDGGFTAVKALPYVFVGLTLVAGLERSIASSAIDSLVVPVLVSLKLPEEVSLLIVSKYLAGGTAMMGVAHELIVEQRLSIPELNRCAGLVINPCDLVGLSVLLAAGDRVRSVAGFALAGWVIALAVRGVIHLAVF